MKNLKNYTDQKLNNILNRLNKDLAKEKTIEKEVPTIIAKTYAMCINKIETEIKKRK